MRVTGKEDFMKPAKLLSAIAVSLLLPTTGALAASATAELKDAQGKSVGTVELADTPSGYILVTAEGEGLPAGEHGFHIHETGKCDAAGGFKSAGGHLAAGRDHGVMSEGGKHPGDLPNLFVASDGKYAFETFIAGGAVADNWFDDVELFDDDGTAMMVHSGADDYESQPSGAAGERIACGVIEKQ